MKTHFIFRCFFKLFPYIFIFVGFILIFFSLSSHEKYTYIEGIFGVIFVLSGISLFCFMYNNIYFIMDPNTLTVIKKAHCWKKSKINFLIFICILYIFLIYYLPEN